MNLLDLLKTLAPGFLPLFAYLGAELLFGERVGLFAGIGLGVAEFIFRLVKDRKADYFALAETILLAAMGALSLASGNGVYFRLKPAITEGLTALGMAVLLFLPEGILREYFGRQLRGIELGDEAMKGLRKNLLLIAGVLVAHAGLTVWAALAASPAVWGFISGGLLYILLGAVFAWRMLGARRSARARPTIPPQRGVSLEWRLALFDETGKILAVRPGRDPGLAWDIPLGGMASSLVEVQEKIGAGLGRLGVGAASGKLEESSGIPPAGVIPTLSLRPLFLADGKGGLAGDPASALDLSAFFENPKPLPAGFLVVFAAVLPRQMEPKGLDPTTARFWPISDLLALEGGSLLSADLSNLAASLAAYRDSLRNPAPDL